MAAVAEPAVRECPRGHPMTESNVYVRPDGARVCRECDREASRRYRRAGPGMTGRETCAHPRTPENTDTGGHCRQCERDRQRERRSAAGAREVARPRPTRCPDCGEPALEVRVPDRSGRRRTVMVPVLVEPVEVECPRARCQWCAGLRKQGAVERAAMCGRCGGSGWTGEATPRARTVAVAEDGTARRLSSPGLGQSQSPPRQEGEAVHGYHECAAA